MNISIELVLGIWGATVSTAMAILNLYKHVREKPKITVVGTPVSTTSSGNDDSHGVIIKVKHGEDLLTEEANVDIAVTNTGFVPCQITSVYVENDKYFNYVIPDKLPVSVDPSTTLNLTIQPEWFAPYRPADLKDENKGILEEDVLAIGIVDGLGKKHPVAQHNRDHIVEKCRQLPLRRILYRNKESGNLVAAFKVTDEAKIVRKG